MPGRVPYHEGTRAAIERIGFVFVASLREDDAPRHTEDKWRARGQRKERDNHVARFRAALGLDDGTSLNRDVILTAFKQKAKEHHPDSGGDPEVFRSIVEARDRILEPIGGS
ncbi:MAG: hypothetical protein CBC34_006600 [Hyphomicrobiaceae bacterium TMED74]|nr:hypothetical protein [Filomicrobium sp.]RPG43235.1 MAG: hypothetical protein CBC34_006600 [Hyphomicrobiaceae bacterium TMED74]